MEWLQDPPSFLSPVEAGAVIIGGVRPAIAVTPRGITPVVARIIVATAAAIPATIGVIAAVEAAPSRIVGPIATPPPAAAPVNQLRVTIGAVGRPMMVLRLYLSRGRQR